MANKFEKRKWPDRQSQHPVRRRLIQTDTEGVYDVEREEGEVTEAGRSFSRENMEDLEERIHVAFENLDATDITIIDSQKLFVANTVEGAMEELFQYAAKGKSAIAAALNTGAGNTFDNLAAKIRNLITSKDTQINDLNDQVNNLKAELQERKRWYFGNITVTKSVKTDENKKKDSVSVSCPINFGFKPSRVLVYADGDLTGKIITTFYEKYYVQRLMPGTDDYPEDGHWKACILPSSNNIVIKVWQNNTPAVAPLVINAGTYRVIAIGD